MLRFITAGLLFVLAILMPVKAQKPNRLINPTEIFKKADILNDSSRYLQSADTLRLIGKGDTSYVEALSKLASNYLSAKKYSEAIACVNKAQSFKSKYGLHLILIKGNCYDEWGKPDSAISVFQEALKKYPHQYLLYYNLGVVYWGNKQYEPALKAFQQSIHCNPFYASGHLALGRMSALMGHYTHAMLSLETYLILEPDSHRSNSNLIFLNDFVNNALISDKDHIPPVGNNQAFEETDQLIKAGISMNKGYPSNIKFDAPISKQAQILFETLSFTPNTDDFWMNNYVPLFLKIKQYNHTEDFIYKILTSVPDKKISKILDNRKKSIREMNSILSSGLSLLHHKQKIVLDDKEQFVDFFLNDDDDLISTGNYADDNKTRQGHWKFYYSNGEPRAEGNYDSLGKADGKWLNYNNNGSLTLIENYTNGELNGDYIGYYQSGKIKYKAYYQKDHVQGDVTYYYDCDAISSVIHFENGQKNGPGSSYFKNGKISESYYYVNDSLDNINIGYYPDGAVKFNYSYKNNKLQGKAIDYYRNGKIKLESNYAHSNLNGTYSFYHSNGKTAITGTYINGYKTGQWKEYDEEGTLSEITNYNEKGYPDGENKGFDSDGKLYYSFLFDNNKLKVATYYDKQGQVIKSIKLTTEASKIQGFYPDGSLLYTGNYQYGLMNGEWIYFYKSGQKKMIKNFKNNKLEGIYISYYPTGEKQSEINYTNKAFDGLYTQYYPNGKIKTDGWYVNGKQEGTWRYWHADGSPNQTLDFLEGEYNGYIEDYSPDHRVQYSSEYKNGKLASLAVFDSTGKAISEVNFDKNPNYSLCYLDGKIRSKADFSCNQMNSEYTFIDKTGKTESIFHYLNGQKDGRYVSYYANGKIKCEGNYESNNQTGIWKYYNENGLLSKTGKFVNDERDSIWIKYHPNGQISEILKYREGKMIDTAKYFDPAGEFMYSIIFDKNELTGYQYANANGTFFQRINPKDSGIIVTFYKNGLKSSEQQYKYGVLYGRQVLYFSNGNKYKEFNLINNNLEGRYAEYYENGRPKIRGSYLNDEYHGTFQYFRQDGSPEHIGDYKYDSEHGKTFFFDVQGKLTKVEKYWGGIQI